MRYEILIFRFPSKLLRSLAKEIGDFFGLNESIFYTPAYTVGKVHHTAFGKLLSRVNTARRDLKCKGLMEGRVLKIAPKITSSVGCALKS